MSDSFFELMGIQWNESSHFKLLGKSNKPYQFFREKQQKMISDARKTVQEYLEVYKHESIIDCIKAIISTRIAQKKTNPLIAQFIQKPTKYITIQQLHERILSSQSKSELQFKKQFFSELNQESITDYEQLLKCVLFPLKRKYDSVKYYEVVSEIIQFGFQRNRITRPKLKKIVSLTMEKIGLLEAKIKKGEKTIFNQLYLKSLREMKKIFSTILNKEDELVIQYLSDSFENILNTLKKKRKYKSNDNAFTECSQEFSQILNNDEEIKAEEIFRHIKENLNFLQKCFGIPDSIQATILKNLENWNYPINTIEFLEERLSKISNHSLYSKHNFENETHYNNWMESEKFQLKKIIRSTEEIQQQIQHSKHKQIQLSNYLQTEMKFKKPTANKISVSLLAIQGIKANNPQSKIFAKFDYENLRGKTTAIPIEKKIKWPNAQVFTFVLSQKNSPITISLWEAKNNSEKYIPLGKIDIDTGSLNINTRKVAWITLKKSKSTDQVSGKAKISMEHFIEEKEPDPDILKQIYISPSKGISTKQTTTSLLDFHNILIDIIEKALCSPFGVLSRRKEEEENLENFGINEINDIDSQNISQKSGINTWHILSILVSPVFADLITEFVLRFGLNENYLRVTLLDILTRNLEEDRRILFSVDFLLTKIEQQLRDNSQFGAFTRKENILLRQIFQRLLDLVALNIQQFSLIFPQNKPSGCLHHCINIFSTLINISQIPNFEISFDLYYEKREELGLTSTTNVYLTEIQQRASQTEILLSILIISGIYENYFNIFNPLALETLDTYIEELKTAVEGLFLEPQHHNGIAKPRIMEVFEPKQETEELSEFFHLLETEKDKIKMLTVVDLVQQQITDINEYLFSQSFPKHFPLLEITVLQYTKILFTDIFKLMISDNSYKINNFLLSKKLTKFNSILSNLDIRSLELFPVSRIFLPILKAWLEYLRQEKERWIENTLLNNANDRQFFASQGNMLIFDLFKTYQIELEFLSKLDWNDNNYHKIIVRFSKMIDKITKFLIAKIYESFHFEEISSGIKQENSFQSMCMILNLFPIMSDSVNSITITEESQRERTKFYTITSYFCSLISILNKIIDKFQLLKLDIKSLLKKNETNENNLQNIKSPLNFNSLYSNTEDDTNLKITTLIEFIVESIDPEILTLFEHMISVHLRSSEYNQNKSKTKRRRNFIEKDVQIRKHYARKLIAPLYTYLQYQTYIYSANLPQNIYLQFFEILFNSTFENLKKVMIPHSFLSLEPQNTGYFLHKPQTQIKSLPKEHSLIFHYTIEILKSFFFSNGNGVSAQKIQNRVFDLQVIIELFQKDTQYLIDLIHLQIPQKNVLIDFCMEKQTTLDENSKLWLRTVLSILFGRSKEKIVLEFIQSLKWEAL